MDYPNEFNKKSLLKMLKTPDGEFSIIYNRVMESLKRGEYGVGIDEVYESVCDIINFDRIREREKIIRHDVKARIEEFNFLASVYSFVKQIVLEDLVKTGLLKQPNG